MIAKLIRMNNFMKILHVDSAKGYGGGQRQLLFIIRELQKAESIDQALVVGPGSAIRRKVVDMGVPVVQLDQRNNFDLFSAAKLKRYVQKFQPSIIHVHSSGPISFTCVTMLARYLGMSSPPIIVNTRRISSPLKGRFRRRSYLKGVDYHIAISRAVVQALSQIKIPSEKVILIPSGIDIPETIDREAVRRDLLGLTRFDENHFIIGTAGNLLPIKHFDLVIEAVANVLREKSSVSLVIFGDGPLREKLEKKTMALGLESQVCFSGHIEEPERFFAGLDLYVQASRSEGLGTSQIDAMARGVPLLGSDTTGIRDVIENEVNGFLFKANSTEDLERKILYMINKPEQRKQLGINGIRIAKEKFDIKDNVKHLIEFYKTIQEF